MSSFELIVSFSDTNPSDLKVNVFLMFVSYN